jgi:hypothetical protein
MFLMGHYAIYGHRTVTIDVRDAESGAPIPGAEVRTAYSQNEFAYNRPDLQTSLTQADGSVTTTIAKFDHGWFASAPGYIPTEPDQTELEPQPEAAELSGHVTLRLYRLPEPTVRVLVPAGYRGPLFIEIVNSEHGTTIPGTRQFTFRASEAGYVPVESNPLITLAIRLHYSNWFEVVDGDGLTIRAQSPGNPSIHWIACIRSRELFVVGSQHDAELQRARVTRVVDEQRHVITDDLEAFQALFDNAARQSER